MSKFLDNFFSKHVHNQRISRHLSVCAKCTLYICRMCAKRTFVCCVHCVHCVHLYEHMLYETRYTWICRERERSILNNLWINIEISVYYCISGSNKLITNLINLLCKIRFAKVELILLWSVAGTLLADGQKYPHILKNK